MNQKHNLKVLQLDAINTTIFNKSCENLSELKDNSVQCIITSPPYFNMRDYGNSRDELGRERSIDKFISNLVNHFSDCNRVLKDTGSLWVNLNDCIVDKQYHLIPHQFALAMIKTGWILNDEIMWTKNNPVYTRAMRSVRAHEYLFHFVKTKNFYYNMEWAREMNDNPQFCLGRGGVGTKLKSVFNFRDNIINTSVSNINSLRNRCIEEGFVCNHSAAFPYEIPAIAIFSTSQVGDIVLDIFNGTGTTGEVAIANDRQYIGYELNSDFVNVSKVRLSPYLADEFDYEMAA
jgi:DNA modification methylase